MQPNLDLAQRLNRVAYVLSAIVLLLVGMMRRIKIDLGIDFGFLPPVHALLNGLCAVLLITALYFIKNKQVELHRKAIYGAMLCSALFLLCYVLYHFTTPEVLYGDANGDHVLDDAERAAVGSSRTLYLVVLLSHIVLAAVSLPFILLTFIRGFTYQVEKHRSMARWVYWLWLYVAITGPICYLMLKPYY